MEEQSESHLLTNDQSQRQMLLDFIMNINPITKNKEFGNKITFIFKKQKICIFINLRFGTEHSKLSPLLSY